MKSYSADILSDFIGKLEEELNIKNKIHKSEESQLQTIVSVFDNYLKYYCDLNPKGVRTIRGPHPSCIIEFYKNVDVEDVSACLRKSFMELGIRFKQHKFSGSLSMFSCKNNTVPGLLDGRGYFLVSFSDGFKGRGCSVKIECLRDNQVIKILDGKLENLTVVFWNGRGMSRSTFSASEIDPHIIPVCEETGLLNLELVSTNRKNIKAKAEFTKTLNDGIILERITSIDRG